MHLGNHYFGHATILARYVGLRVAPPIWGALQHGWNDTTGFGAHLPPRVFRPLVWSRSNVEALRASGRDGVAIGAPFGYLAAGRPDPRRAASGVLVYPFHGWEREAAAGGSHDDFAEEISRREGEPVTVCLFWIEHRDPAVRRAYEQRGFEVITHGTRDDPEFLDRQWATISRHRRVVTNRVATALWYGAAMGREIEVYGPAMGIGGDLERTVKEHRRRWPELYAGPVRGDAARSMAEQELGLGCLREPEALAEILGWTGLQRALGQPLAGGVRSLMRLKRRLEGW